MPFLREILHYLRVFQRHLGWRLYLVFLLTALVAVAEGIGIALLLPLIDAFDAAPSVQEEAGRAERILLGIVEFLGLAGSVLGILFLIGAVFIGKGMLKFAEAGYKAYLQYQLVRDLKIRLFNEYSTIRYQYYVRRSTGHFLNMIQTQADGLYSAFRAFAGFGTHLVAAWIYFGVATLLAWRFALFALVVGTVVLVLFRGLNRYVRKLSHSVAREQSRMNALLIQSIHGFKYIVATGQTRRIREDVTLSIRRYTGFKFRQAFASAFTKGVQEPIAIALVLAIVAVQVVFLEARLEPILVSLVLFYRSMSHVMRVQADWQETMDTIASVDLVEEELKETRQWRESGGHLKLPPFSRELMLRGVHFKYEAEAAWVLQDVSIRIPARSTVAFVGPSGAGKTTIIDMFTLLLRPVKGEVLIDGVPAREVDLASWRSQIGYVSQDVVIFNDTIANNICLWEGDYERDPEVRRRVHEAARRAYAHHFIEELSDGYLTRTGDRGVRLSGGQRQRLFIARELFKHPRLLIMDEATSALDSESEESIQKSLALLKGRTTIVLIAHRLSTIKSADCIYVIEGGRVVEAGSYEDLARRGDRFQRMVEMQNL